jgi:hypothetical protein
VRAIEGASERRSIPLLDCEGRPEPESLIALSVLARPRTLVTPPSARELATHSGNRDYVAAGIARLHPGLLERLRVIADRFPGHAIEIVSGYRPEASSESRHHFGLALDVRVVGASLDAVHAVVSRFDRTGVGLYRAAGLIHIDVRERSIQWIDEGGSEDGPRIVREAERRRARAPERSAPERDLEEELDADSIADEIMRDLRTVPLPVPTR